jgi:4-aminobutyrate aminotransferase-like enzyme
MLEAGIAAALSDTVMQGHLQQTADPLALSQLLLEGAGMAPGSAREGHCFLSTSGAMAVENGLKIAFQARHPANKVLAFEKCFAGRTLGASQITDKAIYREGLPDTLQVDYVPFYDPEDPKGSTDRAAKALQTHLHRYPKQYACMIFELIQGEGGFRVGETSFFETLMKICHDHDVLVMVDEIQSFGRTPELFAYQYFGLEEHVDIVTAGKVLQVCATLFRTEIKPKGGLLSQTFTGSASSIHAGYSILHSILNDGFLGPNGRIAQLHNHFVQNLDNLAKRHPNMVCGPYGVGGMIAFTAFDGEKEKTVEITHQLFENGLMTFMAGESPCRVRMLPPMGALQLVDIDNALAIIEKTLKQVSDEN